jgi:hypothetical protein
MKPAVGTGNHALEVINYSNWPACLAGFSIDFVRIIAAIILLR